MAYHMNDDALWAQLIEADASSQPFGTGALVLIAKAQNVLDRLPPERLALPPEEDARIAHYKNEDDRRARRAAHGLVRHCLGVLLSRAPNDLHFTRDDKGRPFLSSGEAVDFNLSHGGSWVAVGVSSAGRIGVDVQESAGPFDWEAVGRAFLHPDEIDAIRKRECAVQAHAALELWCLKEAFLKATGEGLATPPQHLQPRRSGESWLLSHKGYELKGAALDLSHGACAAFASELSAAPRLIQL
jgi:4'-phosphopantetheinyl transferase